MTPLVERGNKNQTFGKTICHSCNISFVRRHPGSVYCSDECIIIARRKRDKIYRDRNRDKRNLNKRLWYKNNVEHVRQYTKEHSLDKRINRYNMRERLREMWCQNGRTNWPLAERYGVEILKSEGYHNVVQMSSYYFGSPFDIVGIKDGRTHVFQITVATNTSKRKAHRFAKDLNLVHHAMFISIKMSGYIIKEFSDGGLTELVDGDLKRFKPFPNGLRLSITLPI